MYQDYVVGCAEASYCETVETVLADFRANYEYLELSNDLRLYEELAEKLVQSNQLSLRPLYRFQEADEGKVVVALRHDVDIDHDTGLRCARLLARYGVPSTFHFLHMAYYYGFVKDKIFYRNPGFTNLLRSYALTGCEIGLHIDPLALYINHKIDGVQAIRTELEWLRGLGLVIRGVTAHNSGPVYQAENFEIFKGYAYANRCKVSVSGLNVPLQVVSLDSLGLSYEGNFSQPKDEITREAEAYLLHNPSNAALNNCALMRRYIHSNPCFDREFDVTFWVFGNNRWIISDRKKQVFRWGVSNNEMLSYIDQLDPQIHSRAMFVLHPCYFSRQMVPAASNTCKTTVAESSMGQSMSSMTEACNFDGMLSKCLAVHQSQANSTENEPSSLLVRATNRTIYEMKKVRRSLAKNRILKRLKNVFDMMAKKIRIFLKGKSI